MSTVQLNLTRKWRSQNFDSVIGQDLCVRMLKNSLYLNHYFPVYLFAGQRGCGKTSTARIFAAAINCEQLGAFQQNPKTTQVPCLSCSSCTAMLAGKHPDFFEIDAASHTGVDTIRQIIDSSSLLPLMGRKKIYLIDEAHMLSKASFNALLKILEEPPHSVLFMLATTDTHKIIDTVKSRCFQLLFKPIGNDMLIQHLAAICAAEGIAYDLEGLRLIVKESDGSARDAINMLERVRFSTSAVNKEAVLQVLGHLSDEQLVRLFAAVLTRTPTELLRVMADLKLDSYSADFIWERLSELARASLWIKHGVEPEQFTEQLPTLKKLMAKTPWLLLNDVLDALYSNDAVYAKTTAKHALLEMILLQMCYKNGNNNESGGAASLPHQAATQAADDVVVDEEFEDEIEDDEDDEEDGDDIIQEDEFVPSWEAFIQAVDYCRDPLLSSIFKQGRFVGFEASNNIVTVEFAQEFGFFNDWLQDTQPVWHALLKTQFGDAVIFKPVFKEGVKVADVAQPKPATAQPQSAAPKAAQPTPKPTFTQNRTQKNYTQKTAEPRIDISDAQQWPLAQLLVRHFPGTVSELKD